MANITLHHPYSPHIHTKYEITHLHPNMTFLIIPIAYTTYIHTYHTYTIVKTRNKDKNKIKIFLKKAKFCLFIPKYFKTSKAEIILF